MIYTHEDFMRGMRVLELSETEAHKVCESLGIKPFWPVPVEAWELVNYTASKEVQS